MIRKYIDPITVYHTLKDNVNDLIKSAKYRKIIFELKNEGKLEEIGLSLDETGNLYLGINLNPELLLYSETSQETVELKLISEKIKKYTDFLTREGILDSVIMNYDRIKNEEYYGYVLQITYHFKKYKKSELIYAISYFTTLFTSLGVLAWLTI